MDETISSLFERVRAFAASLPAGTSVHGRPKDGLLPFSLYRKGRQNIDRLGDEINACFEYRIYDGCAVLLRRLIETLLIFSFDNKGLADSIKDSNGDYLQLSGIIKKAIGSNPLGLTRNARQFLPKVCLQGHLSAHNPFYCARERDFDSTTQLEIRTIIDELMHASGIVK
ncbi:MAG: hypothetical protein ACM3X4_13480 [Ignavibacteriales bacterium]